MGDRNEAASGRSGAATNPVPVTTVDQRILELNPYLPVELSHDFGPPHIMVFMGCTECGDLMFKEPLSGNFETRPADQFGFYGIPDLKRPFTSPPTLASA